ncbi:MAG: DUF4397 domain-containing protein [Gemmatimonadota bacterium]|nr:DUF4397 domain-containing protein [Gemmatimonadota bacterium]
MRRTLTLSLLCIATGLASGCSPDKIVATTAIPTAGVRFINAVPDTAGALGLDFRFVDLPESNAQFRITFRNNPVTTGGVTASTQIEYKGAKAGQRHFVIFFDDPDQTIASSKLKDSTLTLEEGKNYTVILWGSARAGATPGLKLTVIPEVVPDPGTQVALRVINATGAAIDVRQYAQGGTAPASPTWASVAPLSASSFVTVAPGPIMYNVRSAGSATNLFTDLLALQGTPASSTAGAGGKLDIQPLPGTTIAGSAITLVVFPASTTGARTPQTAPFLVPAGSFTWDRRPPAGF